MVKIYASLIIARPQRKTIADVPESLKAQVIAELLSQGYDENGDRIVVD